jgi:ATP-dependent DNA helicase RecQ
VVHAGMPKTIEHYQQETGRAGRDGLPAECVLLYSPGDTMKWRGLLEKSEGVSEEMLPLHLAKLREMDRFASSAHCRHRFLVEYFGQAWRGAEGCGNCDVCTGGRTWHPDGTRLAQMILSCVVRVKERWGAGYVAEVLRGVTDGKVQPCDLNLSTFGLMKDKTDKMVRGWIAECEAQGLLARTEDSFPVLRVTPGAWGVMRGEAEVKLSPEVEAGPRRSRRAERVKVHREHAYDAGDPVTAGLFDALRKLRMRLAKARKVPPFVIFHDTTLEALAQQRPGNREQLLAIPGMGERKADQYGDAILAVIGGDDPEHAPESGG